MPTSTHNQTLIGSPPFGAAPWHASQPEILFQALMITDDGPPQLAELARAVLPHMPKRPLISQDLRSSSLSCSTGLLPLDLAVDCPWVALDGEKHRNVLVVDIDHPDALNCWLALPADIRPILVLDSWSGRAHAIVPLKSPVCIDWSARAEPKRLASFAGRLMAAALGGTLLPHRSCAKWPWGRREVVVGELACWGPAQVHRQLYHDTVEAGLCWHTEVGAGSLELRAVVEALDSQWRSSAAPPERRFGRFRGNPSTLGRNCALFDMVRWWAYDHAESDRQRILDRAVEVNERFPTPLSSKEVASVAKSIAKFMQTKFRQGLGESPRGSRGRDRHLTRGLSTRDAQSLAARRTSQQRRVRTSAAIQAAADLLRASGEKLTQQTLADKADVSIRTVRRCWNHVGSASSATPEQGAPESGQTVSHQVVPLVCGEAEYIPELGPERRRSSLAEEAKASRRKLALIASEVHHYKRRTSSLLKRGVRISRSDIVRWPRVLDAAVAAEWTLAEAALADARRRERKRWQRPKAKATQARLAWMARHRDPLVRNAKWEAELSRLGLEWERKLAAVERRADLDAKRLSLLRSLARGNAPDLSETDLDRLGTDWKAIVGDLSRPVDLTVLQSYRIWAVRNRHTLWQRALRDAGHPLRA